MINNLIIRNYESKDEIGWIRCRTLAFLNTAYYDNVLIKKETYENPAIELVAELNGIIVGLIDVEYELEERAVCSRGTGLGGMIWHIAVHPDFGRLGIGKKLLEAVEHQSQKLLLNRLEAWTRDDQWVRDWYEKNDFSLVESYYHIYLEGQELHNNVQSSIKDFYLANAYGHYLGESIEQFKNNKRIHECVCYEKYLR